jgi:hypothetical protein
MVQGPGEFGEGVGADAGVLCEDGGRGSRWSQADHLAAVFGPGQGEGAHGDCFPCASRGERKLQTCPELHIWRTMAACPASRAVPFAAISSRARSTAVCSRDVLPRCPAVVMRRCSASRILVDV